MKLINQTLFVLFTFLFTSLSAQDCAIGENLNNPNTQDPYAVHQYNGKIYEGGHYHLRRLDNGEWTEFGGSLGGSTVNVNTFLNYDGKLIIGGRFVTAGSETVNNICSWDETSFSALGSGFDGYINSVTEWDGKLIAGGYFETDISGATIFNHIAAWDGSSWEPLGGGFTGVTPGFTLEVNEVGVYNGDLIAVGRFKYADGNTAVNSIARWDGSGWKPFGAGLYSSGISDGLGIGYSTITYDSKLVVGGWFDQVDGNPFNWIASWDGNEWSSMGSGPNRHCLDLDVYDGNLYGAGPLSFEIGGEGYTMAFWDGNSWTGAAQVNTNWATGMAVSEDKSILYFCGSFTAVNGVFTTNIAQWICESASSISDETVFSSDFQLNAPYPNPFNLNLNIPFVLNKPGNVEIAVYNILGTKVATILNKHMEAGSNITNWDGRGENGETLSDGLYMVKLYTNGASNSRTIMIIK